MRRKELKVDKECKHKQTIMDRWVNKIIYFMQTGKTNRMPSTNVLKINSNRNMTIKYINI